MSYGSADEVAALTPRNANSSGEFDGTTRPTLAQVSTFINQVSALVDSALSQLGFTVPITDIQVTPMLDAFVNEEVAAIVEGVNGSGRFGPTSKYPRNRGRFHLIMEDAWTFLEINAVGIERLGAARPNPQYYGLHYRGSDESGDAVRPIFQREAHGEEYTNWDV